MNNYKIWVIALWYCTRSIRSSPWFNLVNFCNLSLPLDLIPQLFPGKYTSAYLEAYVKFWHSSTWTKVAHHNTAINHSNPLLYHPSPSSGSSIFRCSRNYFFATYSQKNASTWRLSAYYSSPMLNYKHQSSSKLLCLWIDSTGWGREGGSEIGTPVNHFSLYLLVWLRRLVHFLARGRWCLYLSWRARLLA